MIAQHIQDLIAAGFFVKCLSAFGIGWAISSALVFVKRAFESV